ncbi:MAG TPA: flagellar hook protein FlgE [Mesorhizobium sp.]|nr:flagellar hook protein FlgE [Mesorhizobium sp.]
MSLYGMMRTGVSGMNAQANRLSTVADNIANADTTGYKRSSVEFSTLLMPTTGGAYNSGGVNTTVRSAVTAQGVLQYTTSVSDLAINGDGFFIVQDASGTPVLTRAGAFVPDAQGRLVNAAGYQLMGYSYANGVPAATANGFEGLVPITITDQGMTATPSTQGYYLGNLPAGAEAVTANLPSANGTTAEYTNKSSLVAYDNLGNKVLLDVYFTKTADNTWEVAVFDQSEAAPGTSFPYTTGPLGTSTLNFDPANGKITGTAEVSLTVPGGQPFTLDLANLTQLGAGFTVSDARVDGNAPTSIDKVQIGKDGTVYALYADGSAAALYKVALANVPSPDRLTALPGNVYAPNTESGAVHIGFANEGSFGSVVSGALESSNVDIAEELTNMIAAQRSYTANSKVFQTGSELMDVLVNLKR